MLAGVTRIIEISFIVPKYSPLPDSASTDDNHSEHTLADTPASGNIGLMQTVMAFRHLPPFVSSTLALNWFSSDVFYSSFSCLLQLGKCLLIGCCSDVDCPLRVLFMSATDQELRFVDQELEMDHVTYILIMFRFVSIALPTRILLLTIAIVWHSLSMPSSSLVFASGRRVVAMPLLRPLRKGPLSSHLPRNGILAYRMGRLRSNPTSSVTTNKPVVPQNTCPL